MKRREFVLFLALEILAVIWALLLFRTIGDPRLAGVIAGVDFLFVGFFIIWRCWKWSKKWTSGTFWLALVHVWLVSLPILGARLYNWEKPMKEIEILGVGADHFHRTSEVIYLLLILATLVDLVRSRPNKGENRPLRTKS